MNGLSFRCLKLVAVLVLASFVALLVSLGLPVFSTPGGANASIFEQVWETVEENFYDPNFNGVDWEAMRQKYEASARQAQSRKELASTINQMLSTLKSSHTHFYTPQEPEYYQLLAIFSPGSTQLQQQVKKWFPQDKIEYSGIGIFTQQIEGKTFISGVLSGSPAEKAGVLVGDRLLSVDGKPFEPIESFRNKAREKVTLLIERSPEADKPKELRVTPKMLDGSKLFLEAMESSLQLIERQGKKIGYIHIWSYAGDEYQQLLEQELVYGRLREADGLVLDLRGGWGGAPLTALNIYTGQNLSLTNIPRDGKRYNLDSVWNKPTILLVNGGSRSSKEILAFGFQQYGIGLVVGSKTPGAVLAGRAFLMKDESLLYVAVADVYVNGKYRLEGTGVEPDVSVPFSVEYAQGADPQKERAIEVALEALKSGR